MPTTVRNYEALVILNPTLGEEETNALIERLAGVLQAGGASLKETARWGKRKLAYEIEKKSEGFYVIFYFTLDESQLEGDVMGQFERTCRYDEQIMRHMVVKVPTKKRGQEIAQLVPSPGYLADFKLEPRAHSFRRRMDYDRGPAPAPAQAPPVAAVEAAPEAESVVEEKTEE